MPTLEQVIDRNVVVTPPSTTVRDLRELARARPSRIYTWVVVPLPQGQYAVTRMNEVAAAADEVGAAILDMALENVPGLLQGGESLQAGTALDAAVGQARAQPGDRLPVLEGEEVLGVLNLGPRQPPLPALDPWRLGSGASYRWPYDTLQLSGNYVVLEEGTPLAQLLGILRGSERGWIYLVVHEGTDVYRVMPVDGALVEALERHPPTSPGARVGDLPLPLPVGAIEEGTVSWEVAQERVRHTPAHCLPVTNNGAVIGVLAEAARGARTVDQWEQALEAHVAPGEAAAGGPGLEEEEGETWAEAEEKSKEEEWTGAKGLESIDQPLPPPPSSRFFNAGFFPQEENEPLPPGQPLALDGGPYRLGVNVGAFWGPGEKPEESLALDGILKGELEGLEEEEALSLVVAVRSPAVGRNRVEVDPQRQELKMPKTGDSPFAFFDLTFTRPGRHVLDVDLFYQGHLLQSLRVEAWIVQRAGLPVPDEEHPQDRRLTFSRSGTLGEERLAALEKRPSTLTILVDRQAGRIVPWFYDVEGHVLGTEPSNLSDANLQLLLERVREALWEVESSYPGGIGGDRPKLGLSLWRLASIGAEFYRALLPTGFDLELVPGQVIQVAPLSMLPGVPWELLYERNIERFREDQPDRVTLCPDFDTHPPGACPHEGSRIVCPHSFWGYRYIIEQLPNWVAPDQPPPLADLPLLVRNDVPLRVVPFVYGWPNLERHLEALRSLAETERLEIEPAVEDLDRLEEELKDQVEPADILYFYAHGGFEQHEPMLKLGLPGAEFTFTAGDLAAWRDQIDLSLRQPLVVFNACETAAFLPEHHESLPKAFADRGAAGVIGTQVKVHEIFAAHFIRIFFQKFLTKQTVGQSLFETRRELLFNTVEGPEGKELRPDPRGLVYSLFAAADIELAEPVITTQQSGAEPTAGRSSLTQDGI